MRNTLVLVCFYILGVLTGIPIGLLLGVLCEWLSRKTVDWIWRRFGWDR